MSKTAKKPTAKKDSKEPKDKVVKPNKEQKPVAAKKLSSKKSSTASTKPPKNLDKPVNVPVMRCITQLKTLLNQETKESIDKFETEHADYIKKEKEFIDKIKVSKKNTEDKKKLQAEFKAWRDNDKNSPLTKNITKLRKSIYRVSGPASKYVAQILEIIIKDILKYGIDTAINSTKNPRQPKLTPKDFSDMSADNVSTFALINGLKSVELIKNGIGKEEKKASSTGGEEEDDSPDEKEEDPATKKKSAPTYKMVIYNLFRKLVAPHNTRLCCANACKQFISDLLMEFIDRLQFYLAELVCITAKASTVNQFHILSACKLLYYNVYRNTESYTHFKEQVDELFNNKFVKKVKGNKAKPPIQA
uniref:Uncharacterized protein n=1 Tax=viral metagenome TaxID=1070528 RepID=A0A6C0LM48_9ZZZZ